MVGAFAALALGAFADAPSSVADDGAPPPRPNFGAVDEMDPTAFGFGLPREGREDDGEGEVGSPAPFADGGGSQLGAVLDDTGFLAPPPPVPFLDALPTDAAPGAVSDDLSPGAFGKKSAQTYENLTGALDGIAGVAEVNADKGAAGAQAIADAVSESAPLSQADAVGVAVYASDDVSAAKEFLEDSGVAIRHSGQTYLEAFVPARLLGALSERTDVIRVERIIPPVVSQVIPDPCAPTDLGTLSGGSGRASGTWASDCASTARTGSFARYYTFALSSQSSVDIRLTSEAADAYAYLRSGTATSGAAIVDGGNIAWRGDDHIAKSLRAGTYTIEATTRNAGDTGAFALSISYRVPTICAADTTSIGTVSASGTTTVNGSWATNCESGSPSGRYGRHYGFTLSQTTGMSIRLAPSSDDTVVSWRLRGGSETFGDRADAIAYHEGADAASVPSLLAAGSYTLEANAPEGPAGAFTLTLTFAIPTICRDTTIGTLTAPTGADKTGTWDSACDSETRAGRYARFYTFTLSANADVDIKLLAVQPATPPGAAKPNAYMYLRSGSATEGAVIEENDDVHAASGNRDSRISRALDAGTYTVEATTRAAETTGGFTLSIGFGPGGDSCATTDAGTLTRAAPSYATSGAAWGSDCESTSDFGSYSRFYQFTVSDHYTAEISLTSAAADAYLYLRGGTNTFGAPIAADDDGGAGTNARIREALSSGTYTVEATSKTAAASGAFSLEIELLVDCETDLGTLSASEETIVGEWTAGCASTGKTGSRARYYTFTLAAQALVDVNLYGYGSESHIYLRNGAGKTGTPRDRVGPHTYARMLHVLPAGTYTVEAIKERAATLEHTYISTPDFRLWIDIVTRCVTDLGTLSADAEQSAAWTSGCDSAARIRTRAKFYTFTLATAATVEINLKSADADPLMYLRRGASGEVFDVLEEDDDGGAGANSRILRVLSAGVYRVEATTFRRGALGDFTLSIGYDAFADCAADTTSIGALTAAKTANGTWADTCDSAHRARAYAKRYQFTLAAPALVDVSLTSGAGDSELYLIQGTSAFGTPRHKRRL